jgi:hypothetical protein
VDSESRSHILNAADAAYERCWQRLKEDLGLDEEAVEVILNLRSQVTALQARLHQLESKLEIYQVGYGSRLTSYRQIFYEADWEDT